MTENTFPIYKADAIVNFYRLEVLTAQEAKQFSKVDLTPSPKPEAVQRLYMRTLQVLYRFIPECHFMVPFMENIQNPAFLEVTTSITSVYLRMRQFLPMCFILDFSLNDLLAPKAKRTMVVLSGIMNFIHFRKLRVEMSLEHVARFRVKLDKLQAGKKALKEAEKKIDILTTIPPEQQAEARELSAALTEMQSSIAHEYQEANVKNDTIAEAKSKIAEWTQKAARMKVDVSTMKEDMLKLRSQIVESPEELKNQMKKMRENLRGIKSSIKEADERLVEHQNMVQGIDKTEGEIQLLYGLLQDLQSTLNSSKQWQEELQELSAQNEKLRKQLRNLANEEVQMKRALGIKLDKASKLTMRQQKKKESFQTNLQDVRGQWDHVHQKREEMAERIQDSCRETKQLKAKMQSLRDICGNTTGKAQVLYEHVLTALSKLHKTMDIGFTDVNVNMKGVSANF